MSRDYKSLVPRVLAALYPATEERTHVLNVLAAYGKEPFHSEQDRVHLGILRLADAEPDRLHELVQLACTDMRDLLCAAEYPLSSRRFRHRETDPEHHKALEETERREYDEWLSKVLGA